jgi:tRNA (cmo5U34)-methyltransferase
MVAEAFLQGRRHLIPMIDGQEQLVRELVTRGERGVRRFLDLGAGGGAFAQVVMQMHPEATGVLVDFSEPMVAAAQERLTPYAGRWEYLLADLSDPGWCDALPAGRYDAVVSAFCIHHLPDDRKRALYGEAYDLLEPGGLLLNWEHVAASGIAEGMLEEYTIKALIAAERKRPQPRPDDEVVSEFREVNDEDILADPYLQCEWLREVGFEEVQIFFLMPEIAIFGGVKSERRRCEAQDFRGGEAADVGPDVS